jgi:hypothetical protein
MEEMVSVVMMKEMIPIVMEEMVPAVMKREIM